MRSAHNSYEMEIKKACVTWLSQNKLSAQCTIINEFSSNRSKVRADLVLLSDTEITAYEIKSANDSLARLNTQLEHLRNLFNRVEVIVARKHEKTAREICKQWNVGLHLYENGEFVTLLKGRRRCLSQRELTNTLFPQKVTKRKDFVPSENYYRHYLRDKFKPIEAPASNPAVTHLVDSELVRSLNPHHRLRQLREQRKNDYLAEIRESAAHLQSTQSSSNSKVSSAVP